MWLASTPDRVFDVLKDPKNWCVLDKALVDVSPRDPIVAGAAGTMRHHRGPGMNMTTSWEIIAFEPGVQLDHRVIGRGYKLREPACLSRAAGSDVAGYTQGNRIALLGPERLPDESTARSTISIEVVSRQYVTVDVPPTTPSWTRTPLSHVS